MNTPPLEPSAPPLSSDVIELVEQVGELQMERQRIAEERIAEERIINIVTQRSLILSLYRIDERRRERQHRERIPLRTHQMQQAQSAPSQQATKPPRGD